MIVVSPGTRGNAEKINALRRKKGLKPLMIVGISWVLGDDGEPVSDLRIKDGNIDIERRIHGQ